MTPKQFIEKAIEGGWNNHSVNQASLLFDGLKNAEVLVNGFGYAFLHKKGEQSEGGLFQDKSDSFRVETVFIDPLAWQAVGKVEGWEDRCTFSCEQPCVHVPIGGYTDKTHRMIDALVEGKSVEQFLETL